jgi:hypothetical protein
MFYKGRVMEAMSIFIARQVHKIANIFTSLKCAVSCSYYRWQMYGSNFREHKSILDIVVYVSVT